MVLLGVSLLVLYTFKGNFLGHEQGLHIHAPGEHWVTGGGGGGGKCCLSIFLWACQAKKNAKPVFWPNLYFGQTCILAKPVDMDWVTLGYRPIPVGMSLYPRWMLGYVISQVNSGVCLLVFKKKERKVSYVMFEI